MCGSFGMISVVVHFILWLIIMWLVNLFMGVQMHFSIAWLSRKTGSLKILGKADSLLFKPQNATAVAWRHRIVYNDSHYKGSLKEKNIFFKLMNTDIIESKEWYI